MGLFTKFTDSLKKTKESFNNKFENIFNKNKEIDEIIDEIEEILILSDVGVKTSTSVCATLREKIKKEKDKSEENIKNMLREELVNLLESVEIDYTEKDEKKVLFIVGVNGVGKTTSIAKLANKYVKEGKKVLLVAADTFRAGAIEQLDIWAKRCSCDIVLGKEMSDPSSVIYDGVKKFKEGDYDILICDTAGRLHNKKNLMEELQKMKRTVDKNLPDVAKETYIVLDATTGTNAVSQIVNFYVRTGLTGIILTKMDSTAKGGVIFAIAGELKVPVRYVGFGEKVEDISEFNSKEFVEGIL